MIDPHFADAFADQLDIAGITPPQPVDASRYYFRIAIRMRTIGPWLIYLNAMLVIATGGRVPGDVLLILYSVG